LISAKFGSDLIHISKVTSVAYLNQWSTLQAYIKKSKF